MPPKQSAQTNLIGMPAKLLPATASEPVMFMAHLQAGAFKAMLKWQIESLGFLRHRYEQDIKLIDALLDVPEPGEMLSTCSCFFQNALDDYSREAVKAANYSGKVVTDAAREMRAEAEKISENAMAATVA